MPISLIQAVFGKPRNPYRGLLPFTSEDSEYFFGRTNVIETLEEYVTNQPVVVVSGASSAGKSSLVFAGLVPRLRQQGDWLIAHFRPKNHPFQQLADALSNADNNQPAEQNATEKLAKQLETGEKRLSEIVQQRLEKNSASRFLLIVDQFEELLDTSMPESKRQNCLIDQLFAAMPPKFTLLVTLRTEFMSQARSYPPFRKALTESGREIGLAQMTEDDLRSAIVQPARTQGVTYTQGLVDQILLDLGLAPGRLSVLEFALDKLWQQKGESGTITYDHYNAIGGVNHAIARHAEQFYQGLNDDDKSRLPRVLAQMVRPGEKGTPDARQIANETQIGADNWDLVGKLAANGLVVVTSDNNVELVSDALIHHWPRLQGWINEKREFRSWQNRLRVDIEKWENANAKG